MDGLRELMLSEISQTEKDKYCMILLNEESKKKKWHKWTYLQNKHRK